MSVRVNPSFFRLALASIQPANADAVQGFVQEALGGDGPLLDLRGVKGLLDTWESLGDVVCVHKRYQLYSLTKQGDSKLNKAERRLRDRTRLFLLKEARASRLNEPEAGEIEKADVSSAVSNDPVIQEEERPIGAAPPPRREAMRRGRPSGARAVCRPRLWAAPLKATFCWLFCPRPWSSIPVSFLPV